MMREPDPNWSETRKKAYLDGMKRLKGHKTLIQTMGPEKIREIAELDLPFELGVGLKTRTDMGLTVAGHSAQMASLSVEDVRDGVLVHDKMEAGQ